MHTLPGIGIFGANEVVKVLVPILREKGFIIQAIWGKTMKEAEDIAKELAISFFTSKIDGRICGVLLKRCINVFLLLKDHYLRHFQFFHRRPALQERGHDFCHVPAVFASSN